MRLITSKGVHLEVKIDEPTNGVEADKAPVVLLISGIAVQLIDWPDSLIEHFNQRGFRVVRFDNRDVGHSHDFSVKGIFHLIVRFLFYYVFGSVIYEIQDMADDAHEVLALNQIHKAHIVGWSMGGMIGQRLALTYPESVSSLTCLMTSGGTPHPDKEVNAFFNKRPKGKSLEHLVEHSMIIENLLMSPLYPVSQEKLREKVTRRTEYSLSGKKNGLGVLNQFLAIKKDGKHRRKLLHQIRIPTLVMHGEADRIIPVKEGRDLASSIPGAKLITFPGLNHDFPSELVPRFVEEIHLFIKELVQDKQDNNNKQATN